MKELNKKNLTIVMGTRPGIVKMAPVYHAAINDQNYNTSILYTGQHYSSNLKDVIWEAFDLPEPTKVINNIDKAGSHAEQIAAMMIGSEKAFIDLNSDIVLVCGDANTNFATGVAARKLNISLGHVESGLRSHDWSMPEEHNRVMLDHISDYLFAPTKLSANNCIKENVMGKVVTTGNTVVDAAQYIKNHHKQKAPQNFCLNKGFGIFTMHRQENVDVYERAAILISSLVEISKKIDIFFPVHPRALKMLKEFDLYKKIESLDGLSISEPVSYLEMSL